MNRALTPVLKAATTALALIALTAQALPPGTAIEIRDRLTPFGQVCRAGEACGGGSTSTSAGGGGLSGQQVYDQFCFLCHATGVSQAPLFGDLEQWQPRIDKGVDALVATSLEGFNLMPPMGACMSCSEAEMRGAVQYMIDNAL